MSIPMIARKDMKYRTRRLQAGESFRVKNEQEARVLAHLKKAEREDNPDRHIALDDARAQVGLPPLSKASEDIAEVRAEYIEKLGKRPFPGWSIEVLREKMAE